MFITKILSIFLREIPLHTQPNMYFQHLYLSATLFTVNTVNETPKLNLENHLVKKPFFHLISPDVDSYRKKSIAQFHGILDCLRGMKTLSFRKSIVGIFTGVAQTQSSSANFPPCNINSLCPALYNLTDPETPCPLHFTDLLFA